MGLKIKIRDIKNNEIKHLDDFLYDAIFIPEGLEKPDKGIVKQAALSSYIKDFGKDTDLCLVAELNGDLIGAIWTRIFTETEKGYGFVDTKTPELSMSIIEYYRNKGIGTRLLTAMINKLIRLDYDQVSLSVDNENYAFRLYYKFGFETVESDGKSAIMIKRLKKQNIGSA
jgi:ribosomal protein S18 acetylase RimI-like enzyme